MAKGEPLFTADAWSGTHYELFVELGARDDQRLAAAIDRLWHHPTLHGPFAHKDREPEDQELATAADLVGNGLARTAGHSYGVATLPGGARVACGTWAWRVPSGRPGSRDELGTDWLAFYIPLGSLGDGWPETLPYPFLANDEEAAEHTAWRESLEDLLADIGRHVFESVRFRLAVIGHELDFLDSEFERLYGYSAALPADRWDGILLPGDGTALRWHPPTRRGGWVLEKTPGNPSSWAEIFASSDEA